MGLLSRPIAAALLTAAGAATAQAQVELSPHDIGRVFCIAQLANDAGPIAGLLTGELAAAIGYAEARNAVIRARTPGDKPPLGDGIPWRSWPDAPQSCDLAGTVEAGGETRVQLRFGFEGVPDASYTDTLVLRRDPGAFGALPWRIGDVAFEIGSTLSARLVDAFAGSP